jgi:transposase-like protein
MQAALEAEITEFLGRDRYQRAAGCEDARPGSRNGYREVTVKTTAGPVQLSRPKLRGTTEAFASRLFGSYVTKTNALVIASFVSNFIERTFGETRRRTKVIGRLPGETSCLTLVWAVLDRASRGWRGLTMTAGGLRLLQDLRRGLLDPPRQLRTRAVTATRDDERPDNVSATA